MEKMISQVGSIDVKRKGLVRFPFKRVADLAVDQSHIVWEKDKKQIHFTIKNKGAKDSAAFYVGIYSQQIHKNEKQIIRYRVSKLKSGESIEKTFDLKTVARRYRLHLQNLECLVVKVDYTNQVDESNESNNIVQIDLDDFKELEYSPGEVPSSIDSERLKQWNIEWHNVCEDLDTKAYRSLFRAPYIQNVTPKSAVVVWRTLAKLNQANAIVTLTDENSGNLIETYQIGNDESTICGSLSCLQNEMRG